MREYPDCRNIVIDGDEFTEGFLGLDWAPSGKARSAKANFENGVVASLKRLQNTWSGWAVINEIFLHGKRKMFIRPFHPTPADQCNAYASPTDVNAATLKNTTPLDGNGRPLKGAKDGGGTGVGSDSIVNFSPETFAAGSSCATGPGASPDEILLHEMTHGLRQMAGRSVREPVNANPNLHNYEEFVAILVSNLFRSETGQANLRADHTGFAALSGPTTNPATFATTFQQHLSSFSVEQPRFVQNLRQAGGAFNPLK